MKLNKKLCLNEESKSYLMMTPFMILFFTFTVIPVFVTIGISFTSYSVLEIPKFIGWQNYVSLFINDEIFLKSLSNTLVYAAITGPLGYVLSFVAAWILNELDKFTKALFTFILYVPSISGSAFLIWQLIFNGDVYGYANSILMGLGFVDEPIQWLTTEQYILPIIIIVQLWMSLGAGFLSMMAGFASIDKQLYEAAAVDGIRNRYQELWYITIPAMVPHMMTAVVLQVGSMFANAQVSMSLVGNPSTNYAGHLLMNHLQDYSTIRLQRGYASAISVVLFLLMIGINQGALKLLNKVGK